MKLFTKTLVAAATFGALTLGNVANAADKIGVVDMQKVFQALPQAATIQQAITDEFKDQVEEVNRLQSDLRYFMEKQQRDAATMSAQEIEDLKKQIIDLQEQYAAKAQPLQQQIQRRTAQERQRLEKMIVDGVSAVAESGSYDLILNVNAAPYAADSLDISEAVIDRVSKIK